MQYLKIFNTLNSKKETFKAIDSNHVKIYACGPTVYNYAHIGNARMAVVFDTFVRTLKAVYPKVTYVSNITDIDDKIIEAAKEQEVETFDDVKETLDFNSVLQLKGLFALTVNGDSMIDSFIADGDMVLMEPVNDPSCLRNGTIVSAMVPGLGTTLKHFFRNGSLVRLEAAKFIDACKKSSKSKLLVVAKK